MHDGSCPSGTGNGFWPIERIWHSIAQATLVHENDLDKARLNQFAIETGRRTFSSGASTILGVERTTVSPQEPTNHMSSHWVTLRTSPVEYVSVTLSGNPTSISDHMYRGAGFNMTVFSIDWQRPRVSRHWVWGNPTGYTAFQGFTQGTVAGGCGGINGVANFDSQATPPRVNASLDKKLTLAST